MPPKSSRQSRTGESSHLNSAAIDLSTHIADIVNLIKWEELSDVVLCGHSYAGCVIAGVADQIPDRIKALVFLDAFVLENGESLMDIVPSEVAQALRDLAKATGEGWKVNPIPAHILGVRDPHDAAWVDAQCTPQAIATFEERIKLTGNLNTSRILPICFRQNATQTFWSVTNGRRPMDGKFVPWITPLTNL